MSASYLTNSTSDSFSNSETGVNPGINSWKKHVSDWGRCQEAVGGIYFTNKWRAETLLPGLEFGNFKPWRESGIFKCVSWMNGFFLGWWLGFSERESLDLSNGANVASWLAKPFFCLHIYSLWFRPRQSRRSDSTCFIDVNWSARR